MFNFISLGVKCPICETSLMDKKVLIDNKASIKLLAECGEKEGTIHLSSIYNSYNFSSDIELPENKIAHFFCPHCKGELISKNVCDDCSAPLVPMHLHEGGKVSICSRSGCTKHIVEFENLPLALNHFFQEFMYSGNVPKTNLEKPKGELSIIKPQEPGMKEVISSGTFLHAFCPECKKSLIETDMIKFRIARENGEAGFLMLSPYMNVFTHKSSILLPENVALKEITCPHCDALLFEAEKQCERCGSNVIRFSVAALSKMIDFYICSKKGCTWHGLHDEDIEDIILEDSEEW